MTSAEGADDPLVTHREPRAYLVRVVTRLAMDRLRTLARGAGVRLDIDGAVWPTTFSFVMEDGRISRIFVVRNPHKLGRLAEVTALAR